MPIAEGSVAPDFELAADDGSSFRLTDRRGQRLLLVFYPGDNTPVCTAQLCEYRDELGGFAKLGVEVLGISGDSVQSHQRFKKARNLPFVLLSDAGLRVARRWGAASILGMKRAVFLLDEEHVVRYAHVETLALFRRSAEELLEAIGRLDAATT